MKKAWIWGAVIAVLLGANIVQGAALISLHMNRYVNPLGVAGKKLRQLPQPERRAVFAILKQSRPELRQNLADIKQARLDLANYIASPGYNRAEAQKRFDDLRAKTERSQTIAQQMVLDAADRLPPQDRAKLLKRGGD